MAHNMPVVYIGKSFVYVLLCSWCKILGHVKSLNIGETFIFDSMRNHINLEIYGYAHLALLRFQGSVLGQIPKVSEDLEGWMSDGKLNMI